MTSIDPEHDLLDASKRMRDEALQFRAKFDVFINMLNQTIENDNATGLQIESDEQ